MDRESVEVSIEAEEGKLDRNESVRDLSRIYQAWRKWVFQGRKNTDMNATNKKLNQRSN